MKNRREFFENSGLLIASLLLLPKMNFAKPLTKEAELSENISKTITLENIAPWDTKICIGWETKIPSCINFSGVEDFVTTIFEQGKSIESIYVDCSSEEQLNTYWEFVYPKYVPGPNTDYRKGAEINFLPLAEFRDKSKPENLSGRMNSYIPFTLYDCLFIPVKAESSITITFELF